jgi:hypothetical protein
MVKRNSCGKALDAARVSRDMLGTYYNPFNFNPQNLFQKLSPINPSN